MSEARAKRRALVGEMIRAGQAASQERIVERLAAAGIAATQATVSRDLEELGAVKARRGGYTLPAADGASRVLREWVRSVEAAGSLVVMRTPPGSAHVVAVALDEADLDAVAGTIAGDDTVFVAVAGRIEPEAVAMRLRALAGIEEPS